MSYKLGSFTSTAAPNRTSGYSDIDSISQFLNVSAEQALQDVGLLKAGQSNQNIPGVINSPTRSFFEPLSQAYTNKGIREVHQPLSLSTLREIERKNPVVAACVNYYRRELRPFSIESKFENEPGFQIVMQDAEAKPSSQDKNNMKFIGDWFVNTGSTDFAGWEEREDNLLDFMSKLLHDFMTIDQVAIELRRDRKGKVLDFWAIDGATIKRVSKLSGYQGRKQDFDPRTFVPLNTQLQKQLYDAKVNLIPEPSAISFVQQIEGRFVAAYTHQDLIFQQMQKRTDLKYAGYGYSPLEQAMNAITAFLFAVAYNAEAFNSGTIPKIALAFKDGNYSEEQLISMQEQWIANFRGIRGTWRIPMFNQEVTPIDLLKSPRDMEYSKYMDTMSAIICAVLGVDPAAIHLRLQQGQGSLFENQSVRLRVSQNMTLNDMLGGIANIHNTIMRLIGWGKKYKFIFTGIRPEDAKEKSELRTQAVKTFKTVNEIRAEDDLPPDKFGDIILDPVYMQYRTQKEGAEAAGQEGFDQTGSDDLSGVVDEAADEIFKAQNPNQIKMLLK